MYRDLIAVTNRHLCSRPFTEQITRVCKLHPKALRLFRIFIQPLRENSAATGYIYHFHFCLKIRKWFPIFIQLELPSILFLKQSKRKSWELPISQQDIFMLPTARKGSRHGDFPFCRMPVLQEVVWCQGWCTSDRSFLKMKKALCRVAYQTDIVTLHSVFFISPEVALLCLLLLLYFCLSVQ